MEAAKEENVEEDSEGSRRDEESEDECSEEESGVPREENLEDIELRRKEYPACIALATTSERVTAEAPIEDIGTVDGEFSEPPSSLSDERQISRSPPHSRSSSPSSTGSHRHSAHHSEIKDAVSTELKIQRARQDRKYHSKRGARKAGRAQGSKAKQNLR